ncbi:hypothetical protein MRB53_001397 [Persea americana]|uniref:Uncharacterized protein n=1 Tax=Persea americana TaxID=3435 RepID=A0ACC2MSK7_PERAE|nr:hypothetical protein MRB53_001397 [Persea americana]
MKTALPKAEVEINKQSKPMVSTHREETSTTEKHSDSVTRKRAVPKVRLRKGISPATKKLDYSDEVVNVEGATLSPSLASGFASLSVPAVDDIFTTPVVAPLETSIDVHTPKSDINTLIWRIKRLHRERKIPRYFEDYDDSLSRSD